MENVSYQSPGWGSSYTDLITLTLATYINYAKFTPVMFTKQTSKKLLHAPWLLEIT